MVWRCLVDNLIHDCSKISTVQISFLGMVRCDCAVINDLPKYLLSLSLSCFQFFQYCSSLLFLRPLVCFSELCTLHQNTWFCLDVADFFMFDRVARCSKLNFPRILAKQLPVQTTPTELFCCQIYVGSDFSSCYHGGSSVCLP